MPIDIGNVLRESGVSLERESYRQFGAVVEDFVRQDGNGNGIGGQTAAQSQFGTGIQYQMPNTPSGAEQGVGHGTHWQSVQYAADLVSLQPKHRFLFKVHFHFNAPYIGDRDQAIFSYLIKNISRPKVSFEYQDINMYNYRTKVLVNVKHDPIDISFYDDIGNNVQEFFNTYRRAYSPISRTKIETSSDQFETTGMDFASPNPYTTTGGAFSASMGQLVNGAVNILHYIELEQYFGHGTKKNIFKFINPRIEYFNFDEATHEGQELHELKLSFNYDALIIDTEESRSPTRGAFGIHDIMGETTPWGNQVNTSSSVRTTGVNSYSARDEQTRQGNWQGRAATSTVPMAGVGGAGGPFGTSGPIGILTPGRVTGMITDAAGGNFGNILNREKSQLEAMAKRTLFGAASKAGQAGAGMIGRPVSEAANRTVQSVRVAAGTAQNGGDTYGTSEGE